MVQQQLQSLCHGCEYGFGGCCMDDKAVPSSRRARNHWQPTEHSPETAIELSLVHLTEAGLETLRVFDLVVWHRHHFRPLGAHGSSPSSAGTSHNRLKLSNPLPWTLASHQILRITHSFCFSPQKWDCCTMNRSTRTWGQDNEQEYCTELTIHVHNNLFRRF